MTVLVLSPEADLTADQVVAELTSRNVPVIRVDTAWFPTKLTIDTRLDGEHWTGTLRTPQRQVDLHELRSIWYRSPTAFRFPIGMSQPERRHAAWEAKFGLGGVLASLPTLWINHPHREADACYKPVQLAVARRCGFSVPETVVTNDPVGVRSFTGRVGGQIVVKTLSTPAVLEADGITLAHTRRISATDLADLSGVDVTAHLFQEWIDKAYEVRLTAVGRRLFTIAIEADTAAAREDWRNDLDRLTYRVVRVPDLIERSTRRYLDSFGLAYAAFDFAVDRDGRWWFLEANPGGQYGWLQGATGLPISTAMADLLERGQL
jgi:ATP-grasp ribosomal peptide maturase